MEAKERLRAQYTEIRNAISGEIRKQKSLAISEHLLSHSLYHDANAILCYVAYKSEVNTLFLLEKFLKEGKQVYCPKVVGKEMKFLKISSRNDLFPGAFGILEPAEDAEVYSPSDKTNNALVLCPGLAFSIEGARLGYGGGYYDRFFATHPNLIKIGLCFSEQIADNVKTDSHDAILDYLVTDAGIITCQK